MENIVVIFCILITVILLKIVLKINLKKAKHLKENKKLEKVTDKFPENIQIAKEMLEMLGNTNVQIEEAKDTKTSLYIVVTNKISIADMKNNYARIQTIAHECLHSVQDKTLLLFNFIFSNITILYLVITTILTICNVIQNTMLQIFILTLLSLIKIIVRGYLEIDAMTKSRYLSEKYIKQKKITTKKEDEELLKVYEEINRYGIPFTIYHTISNSLFGVLIYAIISWI